MSIGANCMKAITTKKNLYLKKMLWKIWIVVLIYLLHHYKANEILFIPTHVVGKEEPLIPVCVQDYAPFYFMRIQIEDRNEFFIFDTGNETITLRSNYDVEKSVYPSEEVIFYLLNNDYTKTSTFGRRVLSSFSSAGYPMFKDKIVQINFKNNTHGQKVFLDLEIK